MFLALAADPERLVSANRTAVSSSPGLIGLDGDWFMTLSGKSKLCPGIDIFGNYRGAKNVWIDIQKEWKALECPRVRDLTMTVQETQPRNAWKARRLGDYWIGFTWTT